VLAQAQAELLDHNDNGISILEASHRGKQFESVCVEATQLLKELLKVPDNFHILLMHGGGSGQFAAVPLNLLHRLDGKNDSPNADFLTTGAWT